jgi:manganese/iron transport system substrate-binding protein
VLRVLFVLLAAVLVVGVLPSVSASAQPAAQSGQISVVTSILPIADLIKNVGGDTVQVTALVPPGGEPEDYDPTPADAKAVSQARVFFANGVGLEAYLDDLTESAGNSQLEVVTLSEGLPTLSSFGQGADEGGNPHLWLDPQNAISYVDAIERTLSRVDPANAASYQANADRYTGQLKALDASIQQQVASLPPAQRVLVTTHDAYPYFAQRYGFTYLAVINANPDAGPSAREYAQLVKTVQESHVKAVFGETGFSAQIISQLAADTGATFVGDLFTDTLSKDAPTNSYLGAMHYNADTIVSALR